MKDHPTIMQCNNVPLPEIVVTILGPAATHNMPCSVCRTQHAVLDLSTGLMQPCWDCQGKGYRLVKGWWTRRRR